MGLFDRLFGRVEARPPVIPPSVEPTAAAENARIAPLVSGVLAELGRSLRPGLVTRELDARVQELLRAQTLAPRMLGFRGFPAALSVSVNEEVAHGLPSSRVLAEGDLVKLQLGGRTYRGWGDQGWTFAVGALSKEKERLRVTGIQALKEGIAVLRTGARIGDLGAAIQETFEVEGFNVVREFVGYAMGVQPMEEPKLPCFGVRDRGPRLQDGVILHVHAIGAAGGHEVKTLEDGWTTVMEDGAPSVLYTAMVRLHPAGCDLLTPLLS